MVQKIKMWKLSRCTTIHEIISNIGGCQGLDVVEVCAQSSTFCEAVFRTSQKTCDTHCELLGLTCKEGWDETSGNCASRLTDDPRRIGNGCGMAYTTQICRCSCWNGMSMQSTFNQNIVYLYIVKFKIYFDVTSTKQMLCTIHVNI